MTKSYSGKFTVERNGKGIRYVKRYRKNRFRSRTFASDTRDNEREAWRLFQEWKDDKDEPALAEQIERNTAEIINAALAHTKIPPGAADESKRLAEHFLRQADQLDSATTDDEFTAIINDQQSVIRDIGPEVPEISIGYWLDRYIERTEQRAGRYIKRTTADDRDFKTRSFRKYADLSADIASIDESFVDEYRDYVDDQKHHRTGEELSQKSKEGYFKGFVMFVKWAAARTNLTIPTNLTTNERTFREKKGTGRKRLQSRRELWTPEEVATALETLPDRAKIYILLCLNCGFRNVDLAALSHDDIDHKNKRIVIQREKLNQEQTAPVVSYPLWKITADYLKAQESDHPTLALLNDDGNPIIGPSLSGWWRRFRDGYGLPGKKLASLRKTGSTHIAKVDSGELDSLYLGESLSSTAKQHYSFTDGEPCEQLDIAIRSLGAAFNLCEPPDRKITLTADLITKLKDAGIDPNGL